MMIFRADDGSDADLTNLRALLPTGAVLCTPAVFFTPANHDERVACADLVAEEAATLVVEENMRAVVRAAKVVNMALMIG